MEDALNKILVEMGKREQSEINAQNQRATLFKSVEEIKELVTILVEQSKQHDRKISDHEKRIKSLERIKNGVLAIGAFLTFLGTAVSDTGSQILQRLLSVLGFK